MTKSAEAPTGGAFLLSPTPPDQVLTPERFGDELRLMAATAGRFVEREYEPAAERFEALDYGLSRSLLKKAGELGLLALDVPEEYGGLGQSKTASLLVTEKLAPTGSFNVTFNAHVGIGTLPVVYFGTAEQKERYLPKLASGEWVAAYCLTEDTSGSDSRAARTTAMRDGDDWVLNGSKMWISNAGFADLFTVFAQADGKEFSAFLVERDTPGLSLGAEEEKMGIRGSSTCRLILDDVRIPADSLLGEKGKGHRIAFSILNLGRLKLAAGAIGGARAMLAHASRYAAGREQFGVPIGSFGLIQEKLGDMQAATFALESAVYRLGGDLDANLAATSEPAAVLAALDEYVVEYSFIKVAGSEILDRIIDETLQIYGGNGFSAEYPIEAAYRDSRINRIFEGTNEINRLLTSGQLLKRALQGRLDLLGAVQEALGGSPAGAPAGTAEQFQPAAAAVENLKKAVLAVAGSAAMAFMQEAEKEQEVLARVADMVSLVYLSESALLRAQQDGAPAAAGKLARLYSLSACDQARQLALEALRRIPGGREHSGLLEAYLPDHGVDLIGLRREIAGLSLERGGYLAG